MDPARNPVLGALFDAPPPVPGGLLLGDYELLEEVASGGMGVVWKARQRSLDRVVALKTIRSAHLARPEDVARFRTEATAAAALHHPSIVTVHDIGEDSGHHYFTMELVEGPSLARNLETGPLSASGAATLLRDIARAVQFAHERGFLHRDLKPSNILIRLDGRPCVTDFGLARALGQDSSLTLSGTILGSPSYMPPEQAQGRLDQIDARSDVYALGAILYESVTGQPPFLGATPMLTLRHVVETEPVPPRRRNPDVPPDIETICLKCLAKTAAHRYPTAAALAEDLDRFLRHVPIVARPVGPWGRTQRWARRNPAAAVSAVVLLLVVSVAAMLVLQQWRRAIASERASRVASYDAAMFLANDALADHRFGLARELLERTRPEPGEPDLRGWEWRRLAHLVHGPSSAVTQGHSNDVSALAVSQDGRWLASAGLDTRVHVYALPSRELRATAVLPTPAVQLEFSPSGDRLVAPQDNGTVSILDPAGARGVATIRGDTGVTEVHVSADGEQLLVADHATLRVFALSDGGMVRQEPIPESAAFRFAPDGPYQACALLGSALRIRRAGLPSGPDWPYPFPLYLTHLELSPDTLTTLTAFNDGSAWIWNSTNASLRHVLRGHDAIANVAAFSPDRRTLALGSWDESITIWNPDTGELLRRLEGHAGPITALGYSPDSRTVFSGGTDGTVRAWDLAAPGQDRISRTLRPGYRRLGISRDGEVIFFGFPDDRCVIRPTDPDLPGIAEWSEHGIRTGQPLAHRPAMLAALESGAWELRDFGTPGRAPRVLARQPARVDHLVTTTLDLAERQFASLTRDGEIRFWSLEPLAETGRAAVSVAMASGIKEFEFVDRDRLLLVANARDGLQVFSVPDGREVLALPPFPKPLRGAAITPDLRTLVTAHEGEPAHVWSLEGPRPHPEPRLRATLPLRLFGVRSTAISEDGRRLALGSESGEISVVDLESLAPVVSLRANAQPVFSLWFSRRRDALVTFSPAAVARWVAAAPSPTVP